MKIIAIIQARMGSTRLPNKVMKEINGIPMIELLLKRLNLSRELNEIVVATSFDPKNKILIDHIQKLGFKCEQGSEEDVLDRFYQVAKNNNADIIVRITADCPLIDIDILDEMLCRFKFDQLDYFTNTNPPSYPDGLDISICSFRALEKAHNEATDPFDREHVMPYIRKSNFFKKSSMSHIEDLSKFRWTVDGPEDFSVIQNIFLHFYPEIDFKWTDVLELQFQKPDLFKANQHITRNEGAKMNTGQKLWKRAKKVIPGGNMLLSKRPEMFLPDQWPSYFSKSKGCKVWDLDGKEYIDMSIMGIGTNILGYGHPEVDAAVIKTINAGNMSTLNCPEEVYLAEKLIELHPWADMARLARSGGEANAIAIRIARAASGKDKVAICGYHGWHDWYLSANLGNDESLDGHLLPGLEPKGVPRNLKDTVFPFRYNCLDELISIIENHDIGTIKMEVSRNEGPKDGFLEAVRKIATEKNIILIFDECTSGFRETFGGLHLKYNVNPDMAMFGKALGNGYAITAVIGKREIMEFAQSTFISSTFWTERIGPSAALKTLEIMERERSWEKITEIGNSVSSIWEELADLHRIPITIFGLPSLIKFKINDSRSLAFKTLITQEMLSRGYLAGNSVYACIDHNSQVLSSYKESLGDVFKLIKDCIDGSDINSILKGPICHSEFQRLN